MGGNVFIYPISEAFLRAVQENTRRYDWTGKTRRQLCGNILNNLSMVNYVPFDSSTIGNPALDLGDVLTFSGGQVDGAQMTCITPFRYTSEGAGPEMCGEEPAAGTGEA